MKPLASGREIRASPRTIGQEPADTEERASREPPRKHWHPTMAEQTPSHAGLTPEQLEALETRLAENQAKAMNNMFTARMGAVEKKIIGAVSENLANALGFDMVPQPPSPRKFTRKETKV